MGLGFTGIALLLSSCSTSKPEPPLVTPSKGGTYEIRVFELPAKHPFGNEPTELMTCQQAADLLAKLDQNPTFSGVTTGRPGQTKTLSNKKKFIYPTEWTSPQLPSPNKKIVGDGFPVTPATPKSFKTTKVGTTVSFTGQPEGDGIFELDLEIHRKTFLGFINYGKPITSNATDWLGRKVQIIVTENKMEKPVFGTDRINTSIRLTQGSYLVLRNPDARPVDPKGRPFEEKQKPGFIAVIRLASN